MQRDMFFNNTLAIQCKCWDAAATIDKQAVNSFLSNRVIKIIS